MSQELCQVLTGLIHADVLALIRKMDNILARELAANISDHSLQALRRTHSSCE